MFRETTLRFIQLLLNINLFKSPRHILEFIGYDYEPSLQANREILQFRTLPTKHELLHRLSSRTKYRFYQIMSITKYNIY